MYILHLKRYRRKLSPFKPVPSYTNLYITHVCYTYLGICMLTRSWEPMIAPCNKQPARQPAIIYTYHDGRGSRYIFIVLAFGPTCLYNSYICYVPKTMEKKQHHPRQICGMAFDGRTHGPTCGGGFIFRQNRTTPH